MYPLLIHVNIFFNDVTNYDVTAQRRFKHAHAQLLNSVEKFLGGNLIQYYPNMSPPESGREEGACYAIEDASNCPASELVVTVEGSE